MRRPPSLAAACAALAGLAACGDGAATSGGAPAAAEPAPPPAFAARFEDATAASGVRFVHATGGTGAKLLPETMGSGACLFDADGDGALDLFLVGCGRWPGEEEGGAPSALWRGRGDGTFEDVSAASGADLALYGMGCAAGDYDGDGDEDLYVTALGADVLLENDGGRFRDVTGAAGAAGGSWRAEDGALVPDWTTAAAWLDADGDLDLDLFVGGYCRWTPELEIFTTLDGVRKAFTTPDRYQGLPCRLLENRGDGTFAARALGDGATGKALGAAVWDLDGDGRSEVVVANDTRPNFLFWNLGDGRFEERAARLGIAYDRSGRARAGMGIDVADLGGDGRPEVAIGNFADEPLSLWRWDERGFRPTAERAGLAAATRAPLAFGLAFLDLDLDGRLDLVVANGHIEPEIGRYRPGQRHAQPAQVFRGLEGGAFEDATALAGDLAAPRVGRALVHGDLDGDGDLDLVLTQNGGPAVVLANRQQETRPRRFLRVDLRAPAPNPRGLGAEVTLRAGGRVQRRTVRTGSSYLGHGETTLTFGLGDVAEVESLEVRWPDGALRRYDVPAVDRTLVLDRRDGS